jgi:hypothetical protein
VRIYWLPTYASWLDQVEIIFSKVQRAVLTPNDFPSTTALSRDLMDYCAELNQHPKPVKWTYTKVKLLAKFGTPPPNQLAAQLWRLVLSAFISPQREFADPVMWPRTPLGPRADWQCRKKVVLSV